MQRITTSIEMMKASWAVVRQEKSLVWFPIVSFLASAVVGSIFIAGVLLTRQQETVLNTDFSTSTQVQPSAVGYLLVVLMYLALAFITIFFNAALVSGAHQRLSGSDPTFGTALAGATSRIGLIFRWAMVSGTVSVILRAVQERAGVLGRIATGIAGVAWTLVTFLVLPVIVIEGLGVKAALGRSKDMLARTWGEQVVGNVGIGIVGFLAILPAVALVFIGAALGQTALVVCVVLAMLWGAGVAALTATMSGVFQTALYVYASTGQAPAGFSQQQMTGAFGPKSSR